MSADVAGRGRGRGRGRGFRPTPPRRREKPTSPNHDEQAPPIASHPLEHSPPPPIEPHPINHTVHSIDTELPPPIEPHPMQAPPPPEPHPAEYTNCQENSNYMEPPPIEPHPLAPPPIEPHPAARNNPPPPAVIGPPPPAVIGPPPPAAGVPPVPRGARRGRGRGRGGPPAVSPTAHASRQGSTSPPPGSVSPPTTRVREKAVDVRGREIPEPPPVETSEWYPLIYLYTHQDGLITKAAIKATGSADLDLLAPSLVNAWAASRNIFGLLTPIMQQEVAQTEQAGTLFRGNCIASKVLSAYCKVVGTEYLQQMLRAPVTYIAENPEKYEINPAKLPPGENIEENMQNLRQAIHFFLQNIIIALPQCPPIIQRLCKELRALVVESYPESAYIVIGGFFFLRFVGPAIVSPEGFDVIDWKICPAARRALVLISKVIQNMGNGVEFGKKEEYMLPLNDLIKNQIPNVNAFFDQLASPTDTAIPPYIPVEVEAMKKLHAHSFHIRVKIMKYISALETEMKLINGSEMKNFSATLDFLGQPALVDEKEYKAYKKQQQMRKKK